MNHVSDRRYSDRLGRSSTHNPFAAIMVDSCCCGVGFSVCVDTGHRIVPLRTRIFLYGISMYDLHRTAYAKLRNSQSSWSAEARDSPL
jgi:hypothetical protein